MLKLISTHIRKSIHSSTQHLRSCSLGLSRMRCRMQESLLGRRKRRRQVDDHPDLSNIHDNSIRWELQHDPEAPMPWLLRWWRLLPEGKVRNASWPIKERRRRASVWCTKQGNKRVRGDGKQVYRTMPECNESNRTSATENGPQQRANDIRSQNRHFFTSPRIACIHHVPEVNMFRNCMVKSCSTFNNSHGAVKGLRSRSLHAAVVPHLQPK